MHLVVLSLVCFTLERFLGFVFHGIDIFEGPRPVEGPSVCKLDTTLKLNHHHHSLGLSVSFFSLFLIQLAPCHLSDLRLRCHSLKEASPNHTLNDRYLRLHCSVHCFHVSAQKGVIIFIFTHFVSVSLSRLNCRMCLSCSLTSPGPRLVPRTLEAQGHR